MAQTYSNETAGLAALPLVKPQATSGFHARPRRFRASITLGSQPFGAGNEIILGDIPAGFMYMGGSVITDTSLGSSTLAIGTALAPTKYKLAGAQTAVETLTPFSVTAQAGQALPLAVSERVLLTIGAANFPASGNLVIDLFFSNPH